MNSPGDINYHDWELTAIKNPSILHIDAFMAYLQVKRYV